MNINSTINWYYFSKIAGQLVATSENWLEHLIGSISDEDAFLEALEYGRTFRQSDRPED